MINIQKHKEMMAAAMGDIQEASLELCQAASDFEKRNKAAMSRLSVASSKLATLIQLIEAEDKR